MSREFLSEPTPMKPTQPPVTPYLRAQQEWDDRIGATVVRAKNWRLAFAISSITTLTLSFAVIQQTAQRRVIPVIVALDRERGEPVVIGRVHESAYQPSILELKFFITHFIHLVRNVPSDPVLIRQSWLKAYLFLRREAANQLNSITNKDDQSPLKRIGEQTVTIQPVSVVQVAGSNSYQARWQETIYDDHGNQIERYVMNGVFTIELEPPRDERILNENPLGLYIRSFQWNREIE